MSSKLFTPNSEPGQRTAGTGPLCSRIASASLFTCVQLWAAHILADLPSTTTAMCALVLVLAAAGIAVLDSWREVWTMLRAAARLAPTDSGGEPDSADSECECFPFPLQDENGEQQAHRGHRYH